MAPSPDKSLVPSGRPRPPASRVAPSGALPGERTSTLPPTTPSYIGRGFAFPMGVDARGNIRLTSGADDLDASMRVVLSTAPGERLMRPQFGCRIWDLVFEPINFNTLGLMEAATREAITQWEPRVDVVDVKCKPDARDPYMVRIEIVYKVRTTNDRRNLVYPFYVIPREEG